MCITLCKHELLYITLLVPCQIFNSNCKFFTKHYMYVQPRRFNDGVTYTCFKKDIKCFLKNKFILKSFLHSMQIEKPFQMLY